MLRSGCSRDVGVSRSSGTPRLIVLAELAGLEIPKGTALETVLRRLPELLPSLGVCQAWQVCRNELLLLIPPVFAVLLTVCRLGGFRDAAACAEAGVCRTMMGG